MERVKENLNQINALFSVEIPSDIVEYNKAIRTILEHYENLLWSSGEYINSRRGARSASGKARLEMVEKIRTLAEREYAVFEDAAFQIYQESYGRAEEGSCPKEKHLGQNTAKKEPHRKIRGFLFVCLFTDCFVGQHGINHL